jgi:hypothetical protein
MDGTAIASATAAAAATLTTLIVIGAFLLFQRFLSPRVSEAGRLMGVHVRASLMRAAIWHTVAREPHPP